MPPTSELVSVEDYLHSSFEYDAEYVDGRIVERPLPNSNHAKMAAYLSYSMYEQAEANGYTVMADLRIRTKINPPRYRIPDLCLVSNSALQVPFLCIEILSPDDSAVELRRKIQEYMEMGVHYVLVLDPSSLEGEIYTHGTDTPLGNIQPVRDKTFIAGELCIDLQNFEPISDDET